MSYITKKHIGFYLISLVLLAIFIAPGAYAGTQSVSLDPGEMTLLSGEEAELKVMYEVLDGKKKTTGICIRIHYNSKVIDKLEIVDPYGENLIGLHTSPQDDKDDFDNDASTDKYLNIAWMGITGQWPALLNMDNPAQIAKLRVKANGVGATKINLTAKETAKSYDFKGVGAEIFVTP